MNKLISILTSLSIVLVLAGCGQAAEGKIANKPVIRGEITNVTHNAGIKEATLMVEGQVQVDTQYDKASVRVNSDTKIYSGDSKNIVSLTDLKEGMKIEVYWDGPVAESYPVQMGANIIKIIQ